MFLSDISYLHKLNSQRPSGPMESTKGGNNDQYDMELERLYCTSPLITEFSNTFSLGEVYKAELEVDWYFLFF
jgi:hypothetical protein